MKTQSFHSYLCVNSEFEIAGENLKLLLVYDLSFLFLTTISWLLWWIKNLNKELWCYLGIQSREEFKTSKDMLSLCFSGQRKGMMQYRNIRRALIFIVLIFTECCGDFKEALNYLGSLTSELWSLILRDAFSVEKQTLINKDRLVLSF